MRISFYYLVTSILHGCVFLGQVSFITHRDILRISKELDYTPYVCNKRITDDDTVYRAKSHGKKTKRNYC